MMSAIIDKLFKAREKQLISKFKKRLEKLRDFVLEAPILTEDVYKLRDYLSQIKEEIISEIKKYEEMVKK